MVHILESGDRMATAVFWSVTTIAIYFLGRTIYRRSPRWWLSPLIVSPALLLAVALSLRADYQQYICGTHWLLALLGPAIVAFAIPIYEQRQLIRRHWPVLVIGILAGSTTAMLSAWILAHLLGLSETLRLSMLPRSMSMPFAMPVSDQIGGVPNLTALFVILTGILGAILGEAMVHWLPLRSGVARGALFGVGAHVAGVVKAHQIGREEGSIAGLVMVLVGLLNILIAPLLAYGLG